MARRDQLGAQACIQLLRVWEEEWGTALAVQAARHGQRGLVQKVLKTASEYAEKGDLFTRIQVKEIN